MAFLFVPNGVHLPDWTPATEGFGFELPYILEPLAEVQEDIAVLSGLTHDKGRANGDGPGDHARSASVFLTGAQPRKTSGSNIRSGISVDQFAAQAIGKATRFASLELGCERGRGAGNCDSGYSCAYSSNISWAVGSLADGQGNRSPGRVRAAVLDRQFAAKPTRSLARRQALQEEHSRLRRRGRAASCKRKLGGNDNRKLDEYLTGVREIEQRLERGRGRTGRFPGDRLSAARGHSPRICRASAS